MSNLFWQKNNESNDSFDEQSASKFGSWGSRATPALSVDRLLCVYNSVLL